MKDAKGIFILLGAVIVLLLVASFLKNKQQLSAPATSINTLSNLRPLTIGKMTVMVEVADDDVTRSKGLGGINNLPADQGMLFVFSSKQTIPSFWMKDMQIPLDFIWISGQKVAEITADVPNPPAGTADNQLAIYKPSELIDEVLEVNAGFANKNNIKVGDVVSNLP